MQTDRLSGRLTGREKISVLSGVALPLRKLRWSEVLRHLRYESKKRNWIPNWSILSRNDLNAGKEAWGRRIKCSWTLYYLPYLCALVPLLYNLGLASKVSSDVPIQSTMARKINSAHHPTTIIQPLRRENTTPYQAKELSRRRFSEKKG